jgi:hypothetical protein
MQSEKERQQKGVRSEDSIVQRRRKIFFFGGGGGISFRT